MRLPFAPHKNLVILPASAAHQCDFWDAGSRLPTCCFAEEAVWRAEIWRSAFPEARLLYFPLPQERCSDSEHTRPILERATYHHQQKRNVYRANEARHTNPHPTGFETEAQVEGLNRQLQASTMSLKGSVINTGELRKHHLIIRKENASIKIKISIIKPDVYGNEEVGTRKEKVSYLPC